VNRILVIGATGRVGREVVSQLGDAGAPVRALVRNPQTAALPPHVELAAGDLTIAATLDDCLKGADSVFLVWTAPVAAAECALQRIARHARRIVFLSAPLKTPHPIWQQPNPVRAVTERLERLIETSGLEWTFLRPGMFAANAAFWWGPRIRAGQDVIRWPYAAVPTAPIHERDIAAVAVRALREEGHARAEYVLTGPQSLTQSEQISTIGGVIGRSLRLEDISSQEARTELLTLMPAGIVDMLLDAWGAAAGHPAFLSSTVEEITGAAPRTFRDWVTDHVPQFSP
jgi:uncharacterized protein YbjT (DUF2867 family)